MKKLNSLLLSTVLLLGIAGCVHLQSGADPLVVRVEQAQTIGTGTVRNFLQLDDLNRTTTKLNIGPVHQFAESLRQPVVVDGETNRLWVSTFKSLDKAKLAYKSNHSRSNEVITALATAETILAQAQQYITQLNQK